MNIRTVNPEVYQAEGPVAAVTRENIGFLKARAAENSRGRARLCAHPDQNDPTHEMLIVLSKSNYIHPHIHAEKVESFHLIEGEMTVFLFNADGSLLQSIRMGDYRSDRVFYYRQTKPIYHTQIPTTAYAVFLEVTRGPFTSEGTTLAPWAPPEGPDGKLEAYIKGLLDRDRAQGA